MRYIYRARCEKITDGDTIELDLDLGCHIHRYETCRLYRINSPESYGVKKGSEEWKGGMAAKYRLAELVFESFDKPEKWNDPITGESKPLIVETIKDKTGKFGRLLAWVYVDTGEPAPVIVQQGMSVNRQLVEEGFAEWKDY